VVIIYGGDRSIVGKQFACPHRWHGPCVDAVSRYNKCLDCFAVERDLASWEEFMRASKEAESANSKEADET